MMTDPDTEYVGSVTLMILGEDLDPDMVSRELGLTPSQAWRKGEKKSYLRANGTTHRFESRHEWGGWKLFLDPEHKNDPVEAQLEYWSELLGPRLNSITQLKSKGFECLLNIFVTSGETVCIVIPDQLQKSVASLGLDLHLSFIASTESEQVAPGDAAKPRA
jgi:hypothetical protein